MPYYPKAEATAWWDPDEVRTREADALMTDEDRKKALRSVVLAPFALLAAMASPGFGRRVQSRRMPLPSTPTRSCTACPSKQCPVSPEYAYEGTSRRRFDLIDATPYKKVWRCSRCGETFRGISSDNPANLHSC